MGLDMFEVVLEIEDAFEIKFQNDDYGRCHTVGGIRDVVVEKLQTAGRLAPRLTPCLSTAVFCKIRESLAAVTPVDRRRVRPSARLDNVIDRNLRRQTWTAWESSLAVKLPALARPWFIVAFGWMFVISTYAALALLVGDLKHPLQLAAVVAASVAAIVAIVATKPLAVVVPAEAATFRDLTSSLLGHHATRLRQNLRPLEPSWTPQEAYFVVKGILVEQLDVEPERVTPEARIVEDLGGS